jgi:hypothetical protein
MTNRERLIAALIALSLAGNAAAQGGPLTPLDDPRLQPVLRGTDAGPADPHFFGGVTSRLVAGGRDRPSPYQQPSTYQIVSAGKDHHASPKLYESMSKGTHVPRATPKLNEATAKGKVFGASTSIPLSWRR